MKSVGVFLWVCVGCFGNWLVARGVCRYVFYGCVCVGCLGEKEERKKGKHNEQTKERKNDKEKKRPNGRKERRNAGRKNDSEKERVEAIE